MYSINRIIISVILFISGIAPLIMSILTKNGVVPYAGLMHGVLAGIFSIIILMLLVKENRVLAAYPPMLLALALILKPVFFPIICRWDKKPFSLSSETHLFFIVPGVIDIIIIFFYLLSQKEELKK